MRKIEKQMIDAIKQRKNWQGSNTTVTHHAKDSGISFCQVMLHGNHIADIWDAGLNGEMFPILDTFRNWPTRTTVSRLRALGINANIRKGQPCIDGVPV